MDFVDWMIAAGKLGTAQAELSGVPEAVLRTALVQLVQFFESAPAPLRNHYKQLTEAEIAAAAEPVVSQLLSGRYGWSLGATDRLAVVRTLAVQIRAVDLALLDAADRVPVRNPEVRWRMAGAPAVYVVPRRPRRRPSGSLEGLAFDRRGVLHHRILPVSLNGRTVRLVGARSGLAAYAPDEDPILGAALFRGLSLVEKKDTEKRVFRVTDVACDGQDAAIAAQVTQAHDDRCFALVWPELTLTPDHRARIQADMAEGSFDRGWTIPLVVPGSWHEDVAEGEVANLAHVLDGFGQPLLTYEKHFPFSIGELAEDIRPGADLPVLLLDDIAIGFAICLDFCHRPRNPYPKLDVDLMLVPSYGGASTMGGHIMTAGDMRIGFATRTLVVQQDSHPAEDRIGYVLATAEKLDEETPARSATNVEWRSYPHSKDDSATET